MRVVRDDLDFCDDCLMGACNGDFTGMDDVTEAKVIAGLNALGPNVVPAFDSETGEGIDEFSHVRCDCCGSKLYGQRHKFAILGE
jgi:hypothetical protein